MPTRIFVILAALSLLPLVACGSSKTGATDRTQVPQPATSTPGAVAVASTPTAAAPTAAPTQPQPTQPPPTTAAPPQVQPTAPPQPAPPPPPTAAPQPAGPVRLEVHARDLRFDKAELRARGGAQVTAVFQNDDTGVDHNLSFTVPGLAHGDTCAGPCTATQTFTAPVPGRYQFFCTIHSMLGDFIVDP